MPARKLLKIVSLCKLNGMILLLIATAAEKLYLFLRHIDYTIFAQLNETSAVYVGFDSLSALTI